MVRKQLQEEMDALQFEEEQLKMSMKLGGTEEETDSEEI